MPENTNPSPVYAVQRKYYHESVGRYIRETNAHRWITCGLTIAVVALGLDVVWLSSQSHVQPYVVQVDRLGESLTTQRLEARSGFDVRLIKPQLARWVVDTRTFYPDVQAQAALYNEAFAWLAASSEAERALKEYYVANPPMDRGKKTPTKVIVENVYLQGGDTWVVEWQEDRTAIDTGVTRQWWRMEVRIKLSPPQSEPDILANPAGLYITWFHATPRVH